MLLKATISQCDLKIYLADKTEWGRHMLVSALHLSEALGGACFHMHLEPQIISLCNGLKMDSSWYYCLECDKNKTKILNSLGNPHFRKFPGKRFQGVWAKLIQHTRTKVTWAEINRDKTADSYTQNKLIQMNLIPLKKSRRY